jgi:hypothetical protein
MAKDRTKKQATAFATNPNHDEEVRRRAYELYEARGREDGHDLTTGSLPKRRLTPRL